MVISDHADWNELTRTIIDTGASEVWLTHGREDALEYWCNKQGIHAAPLSIQHRDEITDWVTKQFTQLLSNLILTTSRNRKVELLCSYFNEANCPERGIAVAAIVGDLEFKFIKSSF